MTSSGTATIPISTTLVATSIESMAFTNRAVILPSPSPSSESSSTGLSAGTIAGIAIGLLAALAVAYFIGRRGRPTINSDKIEESAKADALIRLQVDEDKVQPEEASCSL
ncbi:hypothetical protein BDR26DRAFT_934589 [Obelidium mucronatum]|nr:hypothetical protein BDR26DRAFT_934589 [Obelidium mucronatum]